MRLKTGLRGLFAGFIIPVLALLLLDMPLVAGQQTCQSGTYNLNGNIKVAGNIEATGTIQGSNVKSTASQTNCVLMGATVVPGAGGYCWDYSRDSKTVPLPPCAQSGHCVFLIQEPGSQRPAGISDFKTFLGISKAWVASLLFPGLSYGSSCPSASYYSLIGGATCPSGSPIVYQGMFDGQLFWPYNSFQEVIMSVGAGTGRCAIKDDPGNSGANLLLASESCNPVTCEYWACP